jgi:hypothetical protein
MDVMPLSVFKCDRVPIVEMPEPVTGVGSFGFEGGEGSSSFSREVVLKWPSEGEWICWY